MSSLTLRHWLTLLCTLALISILANVLYNAQLAPASPRRPDTNAKVAQLPPQQQQQQQQQQQINDIDDRGGESSSELAAFESSVALATIAYGDEARQFALNLLRSVAANVHGSVGGVVVLTDDAEFFRSANYGLHVVDVVFLQAPASELPSVPTSAKLSSRRAAKLGIKWLKTQLFKRIDARFRHVVYLDADVVVGAPLRDFMSLAFSLKSTAVLGAFPDSGNTGSPFHTGVLFASRGLVRAAARALGRCDSWRRLSGRSEGARRRRR
jgi:hypothetical protein